MYNSRDLLGFLSSLMCSSWLWLLSQSDMVLAQPFRATLLTQTSPSSVSASGDSTAPTVSADGRFVVFLSTANNLVTNDTNRGLLDVFIRNITNGTVALVSVNTNGTSGNGRSYAPAFSADGQVIAFISEASDLVPNDTNGIADIFVRDLRTASTLLVTRDNNSELLGHPIRTSSGQLVFFESAATNLVVGDTNGFTDIFRVDLASGERVLVSEPDPALTGFDAGAITPEVSDDGNRVVFLSFGQRFAHDFNGSRNTLFFRDLITRSNRMVNIFADPTVGTNGVSRSPSLSPDGRVTAFLASITGSGIAIGGVYRAVLPEATAELLAPELAPRCELAGPLLNRDGTLVFFDGASRTFTNSPPEAVYVWSATTRTVSLVSSNTVTIAESQEPQPFGKLATASTDGRFVAWLAFEKNGASYPTNEPLHLFVQDRVTGETRRVTRTKAGAPAQIGTEFPAASFSADGRMFAFQSADADLADGDGNESTDVFLYDWNADRLELVSRRADTLPSATGPGLFFPGANSLSADGRYLVFVSTAKGLTPDDTQGVPNVFLRDLVAGSNRLVSANHQGTGPANGGCAQAVVSAEGRWVAFTSVASNLVTNDTNGVSDVFLHDLLERKTVLVSSRLDGAGVGSAESSRPGISPDGSRVAFASFASDLVAGDENGKPDVFLFEWASGIVRLLSATPSGVSGPDQSANPGLSRPAFSPDGTRVLFESTASQLLTAMVPGGPQVYAWQVSDATLRLLTTNSSTIRVLLDPPIVFSGDGRVAVCGLLRTGRWDLVLHDFAANQTVDLVSQATAPS